MEPSIYKAPGPFVLETGHTLPELRIAYHTYGKPNAAHDNVVWVCHALTANSDVADWWPHTVEAGCFLDPARHFVVCANILGSHYGTTGPLHVNPETGSPYYKDFPPFTIRDIVRAHRLLAGALGIGRGNRQHGIHYIGVIIFRHKTGPDARNAVVANEPAGNGGAFAGLHGHNADHAVPGFQVFRHASNGAAAAHADHHSINRIPGGF